MAKFAQQLRIAMAVMIAGLDPFEAVRWVGIGCNGGVVSEGSVNVGAMLLSQNVMALAWEAVCCALPNATDACIEITVKSITHNVTYDKVIINPDTLATSLPPSFTIDDLKALYYMRWGIETSFRDLKYTVGLVNLHGKSDQFVEQEVYAALTAFNFASRTAREVVVRQPKDGVYAYRVNFKNAVMLAKEHIRNPELENETLVREIAKQTIPIRPGRQDRRNLKVKGFVGFTYRIAA